MLSPFRFILFLGIVFLINSNTLFSQNLEKQTRHNSQFWLAFFHQTKLPKNFYFWFDYHNRRTRNMVKDPLVQIIRLGIGYAFTPNFRFFAGYGHISFYGTKGVTDYYEHRPWQQFWWTGNPGKNIKSTSYLRLEERYVEKVVDNQRTNNYLFSNRLRYMVSFAVPFSKEGIKTLKPFLALANEVMLSFGNNVVYNTFDQNRFFAGLGLKLSNTHTIQAGYSHIYIQGAKGNNYQSNSALRINIFQNFDLTPLFSNPSEAIVN